MPPLGAGDGAGAVACVVAGAGGGVEAAVVVGGGVEVVVGAGAGAGVTEAGTMKLTRALTDGRLASATRTWWAPGASPRKVSRREPTRVRLPSSTYRNA